jgi:hypothetical protein
LYTADAVGWLAFAKIAMGWPLAALAALVTIWAVRRADRRTNELTSTADHDGRDEEGKRPARRLAPDPGRHRR